MLATIYYLPHKLMFGDSAFGGKKQRDNALKLLSHDTATLLIILPSLNCHVSLM